MPEDTKQPKITRRDIDGWLLELEYDIHTTIKGPPGELRARLALLLRRVRGWRDKLDVKP